VPSAVSSVLHVDGTEGKSSQLAETVANAVVGANEQFGGFSHVVCAGTKFGSNYLGRVGAMLGVSPVSDVIKVISEGALILNGIF
jgi:electron transfer flavoprotein alpha subunit